MKLSKDLGRPKAVDIFMFMFYWCEQREFAPGKSTNHFSDWLSHSEELGLVILAFYSCRPLSLLCFLFFIPSLLLLFFSSFHPLSSCLSLSSGSPGTLSSCFFLLFFSFASSDFMRNPRIEKIKNKNISGMSYSGAVGPCKDFDSFGWFNRQPPWKLTCYSHNVIVIYFISSMQMLRPTHSTSTSIQAWSLYMYYTVHSQTRTVGQSQIFRIPSQSVF